MSVNDAFSDSRIAGSDTATMLESNMMSDDTIEEINITAKLPLRLSLAADWVAFTRSLRASGAQVVPRWPVQPSVHECRSLHSPTSIDRRRISGNSSERASCGVRISVIHPRHE